MAREKLRILMLDDDEGDRRIVADMLGDIEDSRYELLAASKPEAAFAALEGDDIDLVLIDHALGPVTAFDVMNDLVERGIDMPVILLTGSRSRELDLEAMRRGAYGYLTKD